MDDCDNMESDRHLAMGEPRGEIGERARPNLGASEPGGNAMNGETTAEVRDLIERLRAGDDSARRALLERVYHRLCRIATATLRAEFPRLGERHELNSVIDEAWMRLLDALKTSQPASADEFYSLMFRKVRHVLLDLARRQTREDARIQRFPNEPDRSTSMPRFEAGDNTDDPVRLAFWTEFHHEVANLPDSERSVFDFHYYAELPQAEIAQLLNLHPKQVSRLWLSATGRLVRWLDGVEGLRA
jgi:RNA polymerase sigma factor (sigma-70 family)